MKTGGGLRAGVAVADISPPEPELLLPTGMGRLTPTRGVLDPLRVEALALEAGGETAFVLTGDLRTIELEWVREIRARVAQGAGCDERRVLLSSTHNHCSSPAPYDQSPAARAALERANRKIVDAWVEAALSAWRGLRPAECAAGAAPLAERVGENRRARLSNGACVTRWGSGPVLPFGVKLAGAGGPDARSIELLALREPGAERPFALLTGYDSHIHFYGLPYFSGELPGGVKRALEARLPGTTVLYATGAAGDVDLHSAHPMPPGGEAAEVQWFKDSVVLLGARFASAVAAALPTLEYRRPEALRHAYFSTEDRMEQSAGRLLILNALALDGIALLSLPGELFLELGLRLRARSPFPRLLLLGYNGSREGYVPGALGFEQGSYEVMRGPYPEDSEELRRNPTLRARAGTGDEILARAEELLRQVALRA